MTVSSVGGDNGKGGVKRGGEGGRKERKGAERDWRRVEGMKRKGEGRGKEPGKGKM